MMYGIGRKILIIECNPAAAALQQRKLERVGYHVTAQATPDQAAEVVLRGGIDLILMNDRMVERPTGLNFVHRWLADGYSVPPLLITGYNEAALVIRTLRSGRRHVLAKSTEPLDDLPETIERVLRQIRAEMGPPKLIEPRHVESHQLARTSPDVLPALSTGNQFRQAQKMEAVGRLAGGIAHDFNNLLTIILGYSEATLETMPPGDPLYDVLSEIRHAAERAAALTRQLLDFSRKQAVNPVVLDLNQSIGTLERMLRCVIGEDVRLETRLSPQLDAVRADPSQIEQLLLNLVINARDAMPGGGRLTIATRNVEIDADEKPPGGLKPGRYVVLSVADNGCGMDRETLAHLFEPFFTTKPPGKGTGMGLAMVYGVVRQCGGHIVVHSELGRGTTFAIYLPAVAQAASEVAAESRPQVARGNETVLLVEDDHSVRHLTRQLLEANGYFVLEAAEGADALRISQRYPGRIHLLLTDVVMPHMNGRQLADHLLGLRNDLRVLFVSGYTDDDLVQYNVQRPESAFLQKPYTQDSLIRTVRDVLDQ